MATITMAMTMSISTTSTYPGTKTGNPVPMGRDPQGRLVLLRRPLRSAWHGLLRQTGSVHVSMVARPAPSVPSSPVGGADWSR